MRMAEIMTADRRQVIARTTIDVPRTLGALMATGRHNRGLKARCPGLWARSDSHQKYLKEQVVRPHREIQGVIRRLQH